MKTALALRHVHFENLGILESILQERGYTVRYLEAAVDTIRNIDAKEDDLVIVLGGPIGAFEDKLYPFLSDELDFIERRLRSKRPLLGICLGAQLIARVFGAPVAPMGTKEIGFEQLTLTVDGEHSPLIGLSGVPVLHWHGDQFGIPANAKLLAGTSVCSHQAFSVENNVLALQFHLEADTQFIEHWLVGHASELAQAGISVPALRKQAEEYGDKLKEAGHKVMNAWLDQLDDNTGAA
jgi:GMP synthase (glutamine-hydrolysing)